MKKYQKATITILSLITSCNIASVSIEDYLTINERAQTDIKNADNYDIVVSYSGNS